MIEVSGMESYEIEASEDRPVDVIYVTDGRGRPVKVEVMDDDGD